jgi:hypothetical protein
VLDPAGVTDIFHMPPARLTLSAGAEALRCLHISNKVLGWYRLLPDTDCQQRRLAALPGDRRGSLLHGSRGRR